MSDPSDQDHSADLSRPARSLKSTIGVIRDQNADRDDVVVELKSAEQARLRMVADQIRPLFDEIDETDDRFELVISRGERVRLWIDMTSFVAMGKDKRTFRFLKDTRMGRIVLAETTDLEQISDVVSKYIAEKILERERMIEGEWLSLDDSDKKTITKLAAQKELTPEPGEWANSLWWLLIGAIAALFVLILITMMRNPPAL